MSDEARHMIVRGRVQGVFFRASAQQAAQGFSLAGWVRNCPNGSVEIHAQGEAKNLEQFIQWCRKGPPSARVTGVDIEPAEVEQWTSFEVR